MLHYDEKENVAVLGNPEAVNFIKIAISEFKGKKYLGVRKMWNNNGEIQHTKSGITISLEEVNDLLKAIKSVMENNK